MWNRSFSGGCPGLIGEGGREERGGRDISDGHIITARMWNRSISGGCPGLYRRGREGDRQREERGEETSVMGTASRPGCGTGLSLVGCPGLTGEGGRERGRQAEREERGWRHQ